MAEEWLVVLNRSDNLGFGFSLLGEAGFPHIIYEVEEDSPAARCGEQSDQQQVLPEQDSRDDSCNRGQSDQQQVLPEQDSRDDSCNRGVEAGDVILKVNGIDVNRYTTKEVLKCLRLSSDPVTLALKRDPQIKAHVRRFLSTAPCRAPRYNDSRSLASSSTSESSSSSLGAATGPSSGEEPLLPDDRLAAADWAPERPVVKQPKFEAYMMTGELMLNLSRAERSELQHSHHPHHHHHAPRHRNAHHRYNSTPASPNETRSSVVGNDAPAPVQRYNSSPGDPGLNNHNDATTVCNNLKMFKCTPVSVGGEGLLPTRLAPPPPPPCVRTSRSEDHLQFQKECSLSAVAVDMEDDVTSSLNTLLDTRPDSCTSSGLTQPNGTDRIVWTYNAPVSSVCATLALTFTDHAANCNGSSSASTTATTTTTTTTSTDNSTSISDGMSQRSMSPASPTSVSSSVMSSSVLSAASRGNTTPTHTLSRLPPQRAINGDMSLSEAISNISSPDYQDQDDMFDTARDCPRMELSDPSDSDSTILVSEPCHKRVKSSNYTNGHGSDVTLTNIPNGDAHNDYRIVIQVKGPDKTSASGENSYSESPLHRSASGNSESLHSTPEAQGYQELRTERTEELGVCVGVSETASDDGSDAESLHSFHYSPKAVDIPSAVRLAKRLYHLDGFKKSDVSRHLSKNNEFSRAVAEEYVKHFELSGDTLDAALRKFLARFALSGETQERERVLVHFSRRYLQCNPGTFNSQDAVHTLTCAIMLLNTDLHVAGSGFRRMTCPEFIDNLAELNDGENFPREVLKQLYQAIKTHPLEWALDSDVLEGEDVKAPGEGAAPPTFVPQQHNPFLDVPDQSRAVEYKKGYVMRKSCYEPNAKKTPFGKRSWKMFYCTLRDLVLYLHKDEHGFKKNQMSDNLHNAIRIHHALATKATDYTKKQHVFRLQTADQAEYLFQTSDSKELQSWIETINFVCAAFSAAPLAGAVGSQRKFQRPLLPCSHTKFTFAEQLREHEERVLGLEMELAATGAGGKMAGQPLVTGPHQHQRDKEAYLNYELKRYRTYVQMLKWRAVSLTANAVAHTQLTPPPLPERGPTRPAPSTPPTLSTPAEDAP